MKMLDYRLIELLKKESNMSLVSRCTGISRQGLYDIINKKHKRLRMRTYIALITYFKI